MVIERSSLCFSFKNALFVEMNTVQVPQIAQVEVELVGFLAYSLDNLLIRVYYHWGLCVDLW